MTKREVREWRLPRTRGDGPVDEGLRLTAYRLAPHTRGWTWIVFRTDGLVLACPAHAGMDRLCPYTAGTSARLPRTRGDGPPRSTRPSRLPRLAPHTRGWTPEPKNRNLDPVACPAHAGMDRESTRGSRGQPSLPRTRGDGPSSLGSPCLLGRLAPHTRGWTQLSCQTHSGRTACPAHAGMDRVACCACGRRGCLPRTRGDGPAAFSMAPQMPTLAPHTRGWTVCSPAESPVTWACPAHAGMDPPEIPLVMPLYGLPRTRGDGPTPDNLVLDAGELAPHTRGWTRLLL